MKTRTLIQAAFVAALIAAPALSFAQSNKLNDNQYPVAVQATLAHDASAKPADTSGYGPATSGTEQSGHHVAKNAFEAKSPFDSVYAGY